MTDKFVWNRESVNLLIENYKIHQLLYDSKHPHYKNRAKRLDALEEILYDVAEKCPFAASQGLNVDDITQKIHTLRTQYFKEVNKIRENSSNGSIYVPKLWCYKKLSFLQNCARVRNHVGHSKTEQDETENQIQQHSEDDGEIVSLGSLEDLTNMEVSVDDHNTEDESINSVSSRKFKLVADVPHQAEAHFIEKGNHDDLDLFGMLIASELRKISKPSLKRSLKRKIFTLLMDGQDEDEDRN